MSFFYKSEKKNSAKSILELDRIVYAIDTSGSTAGTILQEEVFSAKTFFALLSQEKKNFTILTWNSYCNAPASLDQIVHSGGGTEPSCIIPQVADYRPQLLILYTDGECGNSECDNLRRLLLEKNLKMPLIIVFTLKKDLQKSWVTLGDIQQQVNMSIPNSLMSAASEVLILLNLGVPTHRVLMASGSFATAFKPNALQDGDTLGSLPEFQFSMLEKINFVDHDTLPPGCVLLNGFSDPVLLDRLYEALTTCQEVSVDLIKALTDRMLLPRLNLDRLHTACVEFLSKKTIEKVPEYKEALENLMRVAAQSNKSQEHIACRQKLDAIKAQFKDAKNPEIIAKHAAINNLLQLMADYRANANQFVLGSNRANRATVFSVTESDLLSQKLTLPSDTIFSVQECPILLEPGNACVLLTSIFNTNTTRKKNFDFF